MHRHVLRLAGPACAAVAAVALLATGCASAPEAADRPGVIISTPKDTSPYNGVEERSYQLPDIALTSAAGHRFNLAADTDRPVTLVFFGYTYCPDICSVMVATVTQALRQAPDPVRAKVRFVFVTTDPARDTRQRLRSWLGRFDGSYVGLTGDLGTIEKVAKRLGVPIGGRTKLPTGGYAVGHGSQLLAFGPDGQSRVLWTAGVSVGALSNDIVHLVRSTRKTGVRG